MHNADASNWNSATTLYIARCLGELARGEQITVLDMGCGDGTVMAKMSKLGIDVYGYDLPERDDIAQKFEANSRIRVASDERTIPFESNRFDVVYANQVFEHVRYLDEMFKECVRVLKPGGTLLANFPLKTAPWEYHVSLPFVHWLGTGRLRRSAVRAYVAIGLCARREGLTQEETVQRVCDYLDSGLYYRTKGTILATASKYFTNCNLETYKFMQAKRDLVTGRGRVLRFALGLRIFAPIVTLAFNAAFRFTGPIEKAR